MHTNPFNPIFSTGVLHQPGQATRLIVRTHYTVISSEFNELCIGLLRTFLPPPTNKCAICAHYTNTNHLQASTY